MRIDEINATLPTIYRDEFEAWLSRTNDNWFSSANDLGSGRVQITPDTADPLPFLKKSCSEQKRVVVSEINFTEAIDIFELQLAQELTFINCSFQEPVFGDGITFSSPISFKRSIFLSGFQCPDGTFNKGLSFYGCFFCIRDKNTTKQAPYAEFSQAPCKQRSIWMPGLKVNGILRMDACVLVGSINLSESAIDGPVMMRGIRIGAGRERGRLHMRQLRLNGDLDLSPFYTDRKFDQATQSQIYGSLVLSGSEIRGKLDIRGIRILHRLHMPHVHIRDRLDATAWRHEDDSLYEKLIQTSIGSRNGVSVRLADANIKHGVWFDGAYIRGQFTGKNMQIGGDLYLRACIAPHSLKQIYYCVVDVDVGKENLPPRLNECIRLEGASIGGSLDCTYSRLTGALNLLNAQIGGDVHIRCATITPKGLPTASEAIVKMSMAKIGRHLDFEGSTIESEIEAHGIEVCGNLKFGQYSPKASFEFAPSEVHYKGKIDFSGATIKGNIDSLYAQFHADIILNNAHIGQCVKIAGGRIAGSLSLDDSEIGTSISLTGSPPSHPLPVQKLYIRCISMQRANIGGNITISLLKVGPSDYLNKISPRVAIPSGQTNDNLNLTLSKVAGSVIVSPEASCKYSLEVEGHIYAEKANIGGNALLSCSYISGDIYASSLTVGGDFILEGSEMDRIIAPGITVQNAVLLASHTTNRPSERIGIKVRNDIDFSYAKLGQLRINVVWILQYDTPKEKTRKSKDKTKKKTFITKYLLHFELPNGKENPDNNKENPTKNKKISCIHTKKLDLRYSHIKEFSFSGYAPFDLAPLFDLEGMSFQELKIDGLRGSCYNEEKPIAHGIPPTCEVRRRFYFWALPGTTLLSVITTCFLLWIYINFNTDQFWNIFHQIWYLQWIIQDALDGFYIVTHPYHSLLSIQDATKEILLPAVAVSALGLWSFYMLSPRRRKQRPEDKNADPKAPHDALYDPHERWVWYPRSYALLTKRMHTMDISVYQKIEAYLRKSGRSEDADYIYFEQRIHQLQSGLTAWIFHGMKALWHHQFGTESARNIHLNQMTRKGDYAFHHCHTDIGSNLYGEKPERFGYIWSSLLYRTFSIPKRIFFRFLLLLTGDGTKVMPIILLFASYIAFSCLFVFSSPQSVERPATFIAPTVSGGSNKATDQIKEDELRWAEVMGQASSSDWDLCDSFWVSLQSHIPLIDITGREKWKPSSNKVAALERPIRELKKTFWFRFIPSKISDSIQAPRADTWAGVAKCIGWIFVPVILGAIAARIKRRVISEVE